MLEIRLVKPDGTKLLGTVDPESMTGEAGTEYELLIVDCVSKRNYPIRVEKFNHGAGAVAMVILALGGLIQSLGETPEDARVN